jgi:hypothetical protein
MVCGVVTFIPIRIPNLRQKFLECGVLLWRHLDTSEDPPDVSTVVAIVKQTAVPGVAHAL